MNKTTKLTRLWKNMKWYISQYKEAIRNKFSTIPIEQWERHIDNCCKEHGCMFDATDCPIELGQVKQGHPCTVCEWQD